MHDNTRVLYCYTGLLLSRRKVSLRIVLTREETVVIRQKYKKKNTI